LRNAQSARLKQKRKEVPDGECAQKENATPAVFTSPQQLSGNQSKSFVVLCARRLVDSGLEEYSIWISCSS
jgi:hypothetical protein